MQEPGDAPAGAPRQADPRGAGDQGAAQSQPGRPPQPLGPERGIMVVDDTPSALHLMVDVLRQHGYPVRAANSGELALRSALRSPPELVLLDVRMPGLDGYEVCRRLQAAPETRNVPVIFLSALQDTESRVEGLRVGAVDFVSKPFQAEELLARVHNQVVLARTRRALDQMCTDLRQSLVERSGDLELTTASLAQKVTEHRALSGALRLVGQAMDAAHDAILILDSGMAVIRINRAFSDLTGYSEPQTLGRDISMILAGDQTEQRLAEIASVVASTGSWTGELLGQARDGRVFPIWLSASRVPPQDGSPQEHHIVIFADISERKRAQASIDYLAHHDLVTGLPNRQTLPDHFALRAALATSDHRSLALITFDIDSFKSINDSLGHPAGDRFLHDVAANLTASLRDIDVIARLSGDEFVVLATVDNAAQAMEIGRRIGWCIKTPTKISGTELARGASIGVAVMPEDGRDLETLLRKADTAMYRAKHQGGNRVLHHTEQMEAELRVRLDIDAALAQAISTGQFALRYQPQVQLGTGRIVGLEALIRWNRPGFGEVQPGDFIAVAEETGHIVAMGEWALRAACEQAAGWSRAGTPVPVSVNISPVELQRGHLDVVIANALAHTGLDPALLVLEITESGLVADTAAVHDLLTRLLGMGVRVTIDDFLTGYSNMTYLQKFEISGLKVDRSFVAQMTRSRADLAIVGAVVQMARALGIPVIAEGVETEQQRAGLQELGCQLGQGYLFAKPLLPQEATERLRAEHQADATQDPVAPQAPPEGSPALGQAAPATGLASDDQARITQEVAT